MRKSGNEQKQQGANREDGKVMKRIWMLVAVTALLLLNSCGREENSATAIADSASTEESSTQESGQMEDSVIREYFTLTELAQIQELMKQDYQNLAQAVQEYGTMEEYEFSSGRLLIVSDEYHKWNWTVLLYDDWQIYIEDRTSDKAKLYTNTRQKMPARVRYLVEEEVHEHAIFDRFIENEISAYDPAEGGEMYLVDYYEKYHYGKNNVYDESWGIYGVHFMAEDLDGDEEEELLVLLQRNASVGDLFVFHEEDGALYAWQEWNHFYDDRRSDITCYDDGVISMFGAIGMVYGCYNSDGMLQGMEWHDRWEYVETENGDEEYKYGALYLYKDGMEYENIVKSLSYEGPARSDEIYDTKEDTSEWTPENQRIKKECDEIVHEWWHSGEGRDIRAVQYEEEAEVMLLSEMLQMKEVPEGAEAASVYDGAYTLTLGMDLEEFRDYYGEEYIPSVSTPTQLMGTQRRDGTYYDWYFYDYEDISVITTDYSRRTGNPSAYAICQIDLWDSRFHTARGITIGDTLEELEAAYGRALCQTDKEGDECCYSYTEHGIVTTFYLEQDAIVEISIRLQ